MTRKRRSNQIAYTDDPLIVNNRDQELTFEDAEKAYIRDAKLRNLSDYTIKYYRQEFASMRRIFAEMEVPLVPAKVTSYMIEEFTYYMLEELSLKASTINTRLRAIRALFNFLYKKRLIPENPVSDLRLLKNVKGDITTFSRDHIDRLFRQADRRTFTGLRNYVIMAVFLDTGVRVKELCEIDVVDVLWDDNSIVIRHPKNARVRRVPISDETRKRLELYMSHRGRAAESNALFLTVDDTRLTKRQIQNFLAQYAKKASITDVRCSPHTFRHTFAKMALQGGANIFELQQILGHSSLEMVRVYVHLFSDEIGKSHRGFSPIKQLR